VTKGRVGENSHNSFDRGAIGASLLAFLATHEDGR
jgi:hypothetical protein